MSPSTVRTYLTSDGLRLHFRHWPAAGKVRGVVVALHGIQSHSGWYEHSSQQMAAAGFEVYFADRRGAGLNEIGRGHADHGERLLNDVRQLIRLVRREHSGVRLSLLGLSWGGKTAAALACTSPDSVDRLVLLYPGLVPRIRPLWWQSLQLKFARHHDMRHKTVLIPLEDPRLMTSVVEHQEFISNDPLALRFVTSGFLNSGLDLEQLVYQRADQICHPTLLMLAGRDQIMDNAKTRRLADSFSTSELTSVCYPDARHTLEFEPVRDQFVGDLVDWLRQDSCS
ncbi:MAG: alpha/beta hydrolase [Fuerstiella sp.]|nr:alpha/beta hydrolase [Fuerstiella sp.]MCP4509526.1 alpha/beta hydrolase [Fuerstiella sp.]